MIAWLVSAGCGEAACWEARRREGCWLGLMRWSGNVDPVLATVNVQLVLACGGFVALRLLRRLSLPAAVYALRPLSAFVLGCQGWESVRDTAPTMTPVGVLLSVCLDLNIRCLCLHAGLFVFWTVCFSIGSILNCVHRTPTPLSSPFFPISLPCRPSLHHFTQHHQGLASWCLHCKSGLTIRRWLDPTHIQKHLIYLFIIPSCKASGCIISDQGDIPTSKCYSLRLQVNLLTNKLKQDRLNEISRGGCEKDSSSRTPSHWTPVRWAFCLHARLDHVSEWVKVPQSVMLSTLGELIYI